MYEFVGLELWDTLNNNAISPNSPHKTDLSIHQLKCHKSKEHIVNKHVCIATEN